LLISQVGGVGFSVHSYQTTTQQNFSHTLLAGDLHKFGGSFATFLETFEPAAGLSYLPDMVRLEWAYHEVFHATRHAPLDPLALATAPFERQGELRFRLHPAARLVESPFPILRIWQVSQNVDNTGYGGGVVLLPVFLFLGLGTRYVALATFIFNIVAVVSYPDLHAAGVAQHQVWGLLLLLITLCHGPGKLSLDYLFDRWIRR
jgi:uncharacterized membrane protein YphA (DoxX/SURF4 family)